MSPTEAAKLLDLPLDATPEQLEARFLELRRKLEDRIAKAPTPGLQAKYRESLAQFTVAFETLTLAVDSSLLPMLQKDEPANTQGGKYAPADSASSAGAPSRAAPPLLGKTASPSTPVRKKSSGKEFAVVVALALLILAAGGWWVMKTRAENTEKTRVAAEQKAEAERLAAEEKRLAEQKRQADEAEKIRVTAEAKAEQTRKDALTADLRTELAESRIIWESIAKEERNTERALNDYRGDARNIQRDGPPAKYNELIGRVAAAQRYLAWLAPYLDRHPAQITRAKIEELLSAQMPDQAQELMEKLRAEQTTLQEEVAQARLSLDHIEGSLRVESSPVGLTFEVVDGLGHKYREVAPFTFKQICPGPAVITAMRPGYQNVTITVPVETGQTSAGRVEIASETVTLMAESDVEFWSNNKFLSRGSLVMSDLAPNSYAIELRRKGFRSFHTTQMIAQGGPARTVNYNFTAMSVQKHACENCNGTGRLENFRQCSACGGKGGERCGACGGDGIFAFINGQTIWCTYCGRDGFITCKSCRGEGEVSVESTCHKCGGDGLLSDIDLAQN